MTKLNPNELIEKIAQKTKEHHYTKEESDEQLGDKQNSLVVGKGIDLSEDYSFVAMNWNGLDNFNGYNIWTDGDNIYYSAGTNQYMLDAETNTWNAKIWNGLTNFNGQDIWADTNNIYYSAGTQQYVLDKTTSTWNTKTWSGLTNFYGRGIWEVNGRYYFNESGDNYVFVHRVGDDEWLDALADYPIYFDSEQIWKDSNGNIYCSVGYYHFKGDYTSNIVGKWGTFSWVPQTTIMGSNVWKIGDTFYSSEGNFQYVYNETSDVWKSVTNTSFKGIYGKYIWNLGDNVYYSNGQTQLVLKNKNELIEVNYNDTQEKLNQGYGIALEGNNINVDTNTIQNKLSSGNGIKLTVKPLFKEFTFGGTNATIEGQYIWSDGENIYHLDGRYIYELDKVTLTWKSKIWYGLRNFERVTGNYVWSNGTNIYYSNQTTQYKIDIETSTWTPMTWSGYQYPSGNKIWTDGENIYYSNNSSQYVLNGTTWNTKTWSGFSGPDGESIWTDGENIYVSMASYQYVLDKTTSTWVEKTWNGLTEFYGYYVWKDGTNIYYSDGNNNYILDRETSTWNVIDLGIQSINGENIWSDGTNTYYSDWTTNYKLLNLNDKVEVDTNVIQEKLTAGTGITINNNVISASGGEQPHLYRHSINCKVTVVDGQSGSSLGSWNIAFDIFTTTNAAFTASNIYQYLKNNNAQYPVNGFYDIEDAATSKGVFTHFSANKNGVWIKYSYTSNGSNYESSAKVNSSSYFPPTNFSDTVEQIF